MEFYHFNIRFWRGDVPRILFYLGNIEYKDNRVSLAEFPSVLESGVLPFGKVPILRLEDGTTLTQAMAIVKFLGIKTGFYPADPAIAAKVEEPILMIDELSTLITPTNYLPENEKESARKELYSSIVEPISKNIDSLIGEKEFIVGNEMTVADLVVWGLYMWFREGHYSYFPINLTEGYENLHRMIANVNKHPGIINWLEQQDLEEITL